MDFYQEQHSYTLARNANIDTDSDEETSWVMLDQEGDIVKLPGEKIYYKVRSRIGLDIGTPKALPNTTPFSARSDSGIVYITNNRVSRNWSYQCDSAIVHALQHGHLLTACSVLHLGYLPARPADRGLQVLLCPDPGL